MHRNLFKADYISAHKLSWDAAKEQSDIFVKNGLLINFINSISQMVVVLNKERQTIYANQPYLDLCGFPNLDSIIGKRVGEATNCIHTAITGEECGTTEFCRTCGAANAIIESKQGHKSTKECRITTTNNESLDLRVTATPYSFNGQSLTIFSIIDIGNEKRREALERVFFHDILNSAGAILGLSEILKEVDDREEILDITHTINRASQNLVDEIQTQHQINAAERGNLKPEFKEISSVSIINDLKNLFLGHDLVSNKTILKDNNIEDVKLSTDPVLLRRIIGNMIKNALEANVLNDAITLGCKRNNGAVQFSVHNNSFIEKEIQLQLFKRSFSTKGTGRGLGTYSMKLLGEKYLKGKVGFESTKETGTTFFIEI